MKLYALEKGKGRVFFFFVQVFVRYLKVYSVIYTLYSELAVKLVDPEIYLSIAPSESTKQMCPSIQTELTVPQTVNQTHSCGSFKSLIYTLAETLLSFLGKTSIALKALL